MTASLLLPFAVTLGCSSTGGGVAVPAFHVRYSAAPCGDDRASVSAGRDAALYDGTHQHDYDGGGVNDHQAVEDRYA